MWHEGTGRICRGHSLNIKMAQVGFRGRRSDTEFTQVGGTDVDALVDLKRAQVGYVEGTA